jgi:membrane fusion protein (multidrug efflux system)
MSDDRGPLRDLLPRVPTSIWIILCTVAIIAVIAFAVRLTRRPPPPPVEPPPVNVQVLVIQPEPRVADVMDLPAVVEPNRVVRVSAEVAGRIEKLTLDDGAPVKAGDMILELNTDLLKAEYDRALAQNVFDKAEVERMDKLLVGGAATERQRDETAARLRISTATVAQMKAHLDRTRIVAPIGGVINRVSVEKGEYMQPGTVIADIVDTTVVKVAVDVPERDVQFVRLGDEGRVRAVVRGEEREFLGRVTFQSSLADSLTRVSRCEVTVANRDGTLRSGQIVRVRLVRRVIENAIMIPLLSVIPLESGKAVYVAVGDMAQQRIVTLGFLRGREAQATSGIEAGDRLIVAGHRFVGPGQKIKVVEDAASAKGAASAGSGN